MKKQILILLGLLVTIFLVQTVVASVGVGVSPSKMILQVEGGKEQEMELLVFNSGDNAMEFSVVGDGNIAEFTKVDPLSAIIQPEPKPRSLPIKNGRTFIVKFKPPATKEAVTYSGKISALGKPPSGSQFGGSVGAATLIELRVTPTKSIFSYITTTHIIIAIAIVLIIIIFLLLKKIGLKLSFEKK